MILADASIWIDFFRRAAHKTEMEELIYTKQLVIHPFVVAELALGSLRERTQTLTDLENLPQARVVTLHDVRQMIEARSLYSKGIGLTDAHLIASCLATSPTFLWTADARLSKVAESLGIRANLP